jgi:hypothetical protein
VYSTDLAVSVIGQSCTRVIVNVGGVHRTR